MSTDLYQPRKAWTIALLLALFMLINFVDKVVVGLVAVPMMDELKLTPSEFGLIGGSFFWLFAIAGVAGGFLADRIRTKWFLAVMALLWAALQFPIVFATSLAAIIAARFALGIAEGPAWPVAVHSLYKWFPNDKRTLPASVLAQSAGVGLILAGIFIPLISQHWGWRMNFVALGLLGLVWLALWLPFGREGRIGETSIGVQQSRVPLRRILADKTMVACIFVHFCAYWSLAITLTWMPAYIQKGLGFSAVDAGRMFALFVVVNLAVALVAAWWSQRLSQGGSSSRVARGVLTAVVCVLAAACYASLMVPQLGTLARIIIVGIGAGLSQTIYSTGPAMIGEFVPHAQRGSVLAIDNSVASIAGIIAPVVTGMLIQYVVGTPATGYEYGFAVTGTILLVGGIFGWLMLDPPASARRLLGADSGAGGNVNAAAAGTS